MFAKVLCVLLLAGAYCHAAEDTLQQQSEDSSKGRLFFTTGNNNQSVTVSSSTVATLGFLVLAGFLFAIVLTVLGTSDTSVSASPYSDHATGYDAVDESSYAVHRALDEAEKKFN